jgi:tRNA pseudouridine55 synthase
VETLDPLATGSFVIVCTGKVQCKTISQKFKVKPRIYGTFNIMTTPSYDLETEIDQTFSAY